MTCEGTLPNGMSCGEHKKHLTLVSWKLAGDPYGQARGGQKHLCPDCLSRAVQDRWVESVSIQLDTKPRGD